MSRIFLVDFENVADSGLDGFFRLPPEDRVYVFYTEKAGKIGIRFFSDCFAQTEHAQLVFLKAQTGNQALDLQLASFLGSLIGEGLPADTVCYIVSKDKGFTCLPAFWGGLRQAQVSLTASIAAVLSKEDTAAAEPGKAEAAPAQKAETPAPQEKAEAAPAQKKTAQKKPASRKTKKSSSQKTETEPASEKPEEQKAENAAPQPAEPKPGQPEESALPKELKNAAPVRKLSSKDRSSMNASVQQALSKAKFDNEIVNSVASLINKVNRGSKSKQELYLGIIKTYGQKQGLAIYNVIKPILN